MFNKYRAEHIGSFLRPAELLEARNNPAFDPQQLRALEDKHILRVLARQKELGFEVFTDGELRRRNFMSDFTDAVEGFDMGEATPRSWQVEEKEDASVSRVAGERNSTASLASAYCARVTASPVCSASVMLGESR